VEDRKEDGDEEGAAGPLKRESTSGPGGWRRISVSAGVAELADARDLKSRGPKGRPGSIPGPGTRFLKVPVRSLLVRLDPLTKL
jgi:hypothetical protein